MYIFDGIIVAALFLFSLRNKHSLTLISSSSSMLDISLRIYLHIHIFVVGLSGFMSFQYVIVKSFLSIQLRANETCSHLVLIFTPSCEGVGIITYVRSMMIIISCVLFGNVNRKFKFLTNF